MGRESSVECSVSFLWTNESFSLWNCLSKNSTTDLWLVLKQPRQRGFGRNLRYILYSKVKESTFLKGNFCIYKSFMDVFYILTSAWKKNHKMCIWNWFFAMCSADLTCVNGSTIQFLLREVLLRINFGFLIRNFQEIKLFICRCSFITLAQKTTVRFLETLQTGYSPFLN